VNPFDLYGPEFLLFYAALIGIVLGAAVLLRRANEPGESPSMRLTDPYLIAYLRGGSNECIRVALTSLLDSGLLETADDLVGTKNDKSAAGRSAFESSILKYFEEAGKPLSALKEPTIVKHTDSIRRVLEAAGLLPD